MCGIFASIGNEDNVKNCLLGLKSLEYRGYDSAGIAGFLDGKIFFCKEVGKISSLEKKLILNPFQSSVAIGHTRWATCGSVNQTNAHPHLDCFASLALVHNGIIENFPLIKKRLEEKGVMFSSDTDSEVIAQLISFYFKGDALEAISRGLSEIEGSFSVTLIHKDLPDQLFCFSRECPLCVGFSNDKLQVMIASDPNAFLGEDLNIAFLEDNEIASIKRGSIEFYDQNLSPVRKKSEKISKVTLKPTKEGFEHFMLKEIFDQPKSLRECIKYYLKKDIPTFTDLTIPKKELESIEQIHLIGCGTSFHAGSIASYLFEDLASIPTQVHIGSEFRYRKPLFTKNSLVIALSQSGETADTIAAVKICKKMGVRVVSLCNQKNSTLSRLSDATFDLLCGPEVSVCSTKSFTSHVLILTLLAFHLSKREDPSISSFIKKIPGQVEEILSKIDQIKALSEKYSRYKHFAFIGRSYMYPTAMEAALKLKEISYLNATAYPAGELKHGPIALLDENFPVIALCQGKQTFSKFRSNVLEAKVRGAPVLSFCNKDQKIESVDDHFFLPETIDPLAPILSSVALQLFAYFIAKKKNTDIDQPKNLAKSVTVE